MSVSFLQVLHNFGIIPAREQYRDINKGVVRSGSSPRAPCGARRPGGAVCELQLRFQSTRPARGATCRDTCAPDGSRVSIHAPRTGRDLRTLRIIIGRAGFNPRAPHGARRPSAAISGRLPSVSIHAPSQALAHDLPVSIHAPRTGRDMRGKTERGAKTEFQSTRPARGATMDGMRTPDAILSFNPRAPHGARRARAFAKSEGG